MLPCRATNKRVPKKVKAGQRNSYDQKALVKVSHQGACPSKQKKERVPGISATGWLWQILPALGTFCPQSLHDAFLFQDCALYVGLHTPKEHDHEDDVHQRSFCEHQKKRRDPGAPLWPSYAHEILGLWVKPEAEQANEGHNGADHTHDKWTYRLFPEVRSAEKGSDA